jgi:hypothetical protein
MRKITVTLLSLVFVVSFTSISFSQDVHVKGHYRSNGTYVKPHYRSAPNGNAFDNYSTKGNTNPYTGQRGTVDPYKSSGSFGSSSQGTGQSFGGSSNSLGGYNQPLGGTTNRQKRSRGTGRQNNLGGGTGLQFPR